VVQCVLLQDGLYLSGTVCSTAGWTVSKRYSVFYSALSSCCYFCPVYRLPMNPSALSWCVCVCVCETESRHLYITQLEIFIRLRRQDSLHLSLVSLSFLPPSPSLSLLQSAPEALPWKPSSSRRKETGSHGTESKV
jgi:hypothetical protein